MSHEKITIRGVPETMLQTLYARAQETQTGRNFIQDPKAVEIVSRMDYDFQNAQQDTAMRTGVVARTILLDRMARSYLESHPHTTVINIACGLDTRCYRMEGLYDLWYNLDLPETMEIRRRFFTPTRTIRQISSSAMDPLWASQIDFFSGSALIIIEGLSMYLSEADIRQIFRILDLRFPAATVFLEVMNPWIVSHMKEKSIEGSAAKFTWGVRSGEQLQSLIPPFRCTQTHSLTEGMQVFLPIYKVLDKIGPVRRISNQIMVLEK